jgi:hypothetical protein
VQVVDVVSSSREHDFGKFHDHESVAGTLLMTLQVSGVGWLGEWVSEWSGVEWVNEWSGVEWREVEWSGVEWFE